LLPRKLLQYTTIGNRIEPRFLTERDHPWLQETIDEFSRFAGRTRREWKERTREPWGFGATRSARDLAIHVLEQLGRDQVVSPRKPRAVRLEVFGRAAVSATPSREAIVAASAAALSCSPTEIESSIFADLPWERSLVALPEPISPGQLALRANLALAQAILHRAEWVEVEFYGNSRPVVRHAKFRGLICEIRSEAGSGPVNLRISGPFSILRRTLLYGRALGELVPFLAWSQRYRLRASCCLGGSPRRLELASGAPLWPSEPPKRFDSLLEERFARDFMRAAPDWELIREPEPIPVEGTLIFPDFLLRHRCDPARRWFLEIAGFWTPDYLATKLRRIAALKMDRFIVCVDEARNCGEAAMAGEARIVLFKRRVKIESVLSVIQAP
jgi:predicted nuclease of restriction endonuclease-like RecB superfamily